METIEVLFFGLFCVSLTLLIPKLGVFFLAAYVINMRLAYKKGRMIDAWTRRKISTNGFNEIRTKRESYIEMPTIIFWIKVWLGRSPLNN